MANNFKNEISQAVGVTAATIYTCPAATKTTVIGLSLCNLIPSQITANVTLTSGVTAVFLTKQTSIPYGQTLVPVGGDQKIVLEAGDYLQVQSSAASSIDVIVSLLEIT